MKVPKIIRDTLMTRGKWSIKRLAGVSGFYFAILYASIPMVKPEFEVKEFVFGGLVAFAAAAISMTVWNKKIDKTQPNE